MGHNSTGHISCDLFFTLLLGSIIIVVTATTTTIYAHDGFNFHNYDELQRTTDFTALIKPSSTSLSYNVQQQEDYLLSSSTLSTTNQREINHRHHQQLMAQKKRNIKDISENYPLIYFERELETRPYETFTLYLSSLKGVENGACENSLYPCQSIGQALVRLDVLVRNWTQSMNESIFNQQQFNIHVKLQFSDLLKGACNNALVTPMYSNVNYLFEIYSDSVYNILSCDTLGESLFNIRQDTTRFYFHDLRLNAGMISKLNYNFGIYNSIVTFAKISVADYIVKNFTTGDVIFQEVYCFKETTHYDFANVKTVKFVDTVFNGAAGYTYTLANCQDVEVIESHFDFLSIRAFNLKTFEIKGSECVGSSIVITKADSTIFSNSKFSISKYYLPAIASEFVDTVKVSGCTAYDLDVFAQFGAIVNLIIENTSISDCNILGTFKNVRSIIEVMSVSSATIINSEFYRNTGYEGGILSVRDIVLLQVDNCTFVNNRGIVNGGAISISSFSENSYFAESYIANSTFIANEATTFGGAVFMSNSFHMIYRNCLFKENFCTQSGGAIYIRQELLVTKFENTKFIENSVQRDPGKGIAGMFLGCGGALTIHTVGRGPGAYEGAEFIGNKGIRGGAICVGYLKYWLSIPYLFENFTLINNFASVSGGAFFFFEQLIQNENVNLIGPANVFKGNKAGRFGDNISAIGRNLTVLYSSPSIESGKSISIDVRYMGNLGLELPLQAENFLILSNYLQVQPKIVGANQFIVEAYFTNPIYVNTTATVNITSESVVTTSFDITLLPCQEPLKMVANFINGQQVYLCQNVVDLETLIISITVPVGVFMLLGGTFLGFLIFYCTTKIVSKLRLLKKKEIAEKNLEKTILDNKIVFEMSDSETNYTQSRRTNSNHYSEFQSPLLENDHMTQNLVATSSVVIPVEDIEITKRIAEGGYGNIYKGLWVSTEVAIKSLKTTEGNFEFEKEAAILSRLRHPNIVSFYGVCITETTKYMVTEFVKKGSLDKMIYKCKQNIEFLSFKEKINILIGVSNGMNYLHSLQPSVIHRDLKPANILLDESNNSKVCDFGLVKIIGNNQLQTTMSVNVGTLFYISNESFKESATKITHKTDVYSFGIVMWELFFLENPYLNASSPKIHHFREPPGEDQPYTVPMKVLNNERPIIPFKDSTELHEWMTVYGKETSAPFEILKLVTEDYTKLMQMCWDMNPSSRPEFSEISKQLIQLRDKLSF